MVAHACDSVQETRQKDYDEFKALFGYIVIFWSVEAPQKDPDFLFCFVLVCVSMERKRPCKAVDHTSQIVCRKCAFSLQSHSKLLLESYIRSTEQSKLGSLFIKIQDNTKIKCGESNV